MCLRFVPADLSGFREACEDMVRRHGQKGFATAIQRAQRERVEFPTPVELEALIPAPPLRDEVHEKMAEWERDKAEHPENYCTDEETQEILERLQQLLSRFPSQRGKQSDTEESND